MNWTFELVRGLFSLMSDDAKSSHPSPHDAYFRGVFEDPKNAVPALKYFLAPELSAALAWKTTTFIPGTFVDDALRERRTDLLFSVDLVDAEPESPPVFAYILFEHQSRPDPMMPWRLFEYMGRIWTRWLNGQDGTPRHLPAIIPLVLFQGGAGRSWTVARDFQSLIQAPEAFRTALAPYMPQFELLLEDLSHRDQLDLRDLANRAKEAGTALFAMRTIRDAAFLEHLIKIAGPLRELMASPDLRHAQLFIHYVLHGHKSLNAAAITSFFETHIRQGTQDSVMSAASQLIAQGEETGREKERNLGLERARVWITKTITMRFGPPTDETQARIGTASIETIYLWGEGILTAETVEDLLR